MILHENGVVLDEGRRRNCGEGLRLAEEPADHIAVVDVEVVDYAARKLGLHIPVVPAPSGRSAETVELRGGGLAVSAVVNASLEELVLTEEAQALTDHKLLARAVARLDHTAAVLFGESHRLFALNVVAALEHLDRVFAMKGSGKTDVDEVDLLVCEHFLEVCVGAEITPEACFARVDIDLDTALERLRRTAKTLNR